MENGPKLASRILEKLTDIQVRASLLKMPSYFNESLELNPMLMVRRE